MTGAILVLLFLAQLSAEEQALLAGLDPTRTVSMVRRLSEGVVNTHSGAGFGTAAAGSEAERQLADSIEREMRSLGFDVTRERFPVRAYEYGEVVLEVNGGRLPAITLHSSTGTWGTRDGVDYARGNAEEKRVLRTRLVDAGEGLAADYDRIGDVTGRVVLVRRTVWPSGPALEAAVRGASAIVFYDYPGENPDEALKQDGIQYHDDVPAVAIAKRDAKLILAMLSAGPVEIVLENRVDARYGFSENVIGRVTGSRYPDEFVAVTAHHDRWHQGAQDNAVGVAVMLELGRLMKSAEPMRSLLLVSFGAEEAGGIATQSDWLTGSYAFAKAHPEIGSRLAYAFNVDGAGWSAETGHLFATLDNLPFQRELLRDLGLESRIRLHEGVTNWVDAWSLGAIGGGAVSYLLWFEGHPNYEGPGSFSRIYHTQLDVYRARDYQNLDVDLELGALGLLRSDRALLLPISLTEVASWTRKALESDSSRAEAVSFEEALSAAEAFERAAERFESKGAPRDPRRRNRALMNVRHELLPWLLTSSSTRAVLKSSPHASDLEAFTRARKAVEFSDATMTATALEAVSTMETARLFSEKNYLRERLYAFGPASWGNDFEQDARPVSPEIYDFYARVKREGLREGDALLLSRFEAQARGHLEEALLLVSGKLREAAHALEAATEDP